MNGRRSITLLATVALVSACGADEAVTPTALDVNLSTHGGLPSANGGGHYLLVTSGGTELDIQFAFTARQTGSGDEAQGRFHHRTDFGGAIEFHGDVTCLTVDPANGRAWIGGVVTHNMSEGGFGSGEIFQPGKDIWFRVLDGGEGPDADDRTTFTGFEGSADIITSAEYCETQPWPDGNERTWPVTGQVQVR